jgi:5,10-methylenetetrahydromethanopterin reductase
VPDRVGLYLQDNYALQESIKLVHYAETRGFDSVWQAETRLSRDAIVPMAAYAATTTRIKIGAGVINNWTRNPALIASTFLTLDDLAPDRVMLGLGAWWDPLASQVGINRTKPLLAMREVVNAVRALLTLERITIQGEFVRLHDVQLTTVRTFDDPPRVPIYIAATGPRMMAVAGEIADGVLFNHLVSPLYNEGAVSQLEIGATKAGRSLADIDRPQIIVCSVDRDYPEKAINTARRLVTGYIRQQPNIMLASGVPQGLIDELFQVLPPNPSEAQITDAMSLVSDDVVQLITAAGSPQTVRAKVREYVAAGATYPILYALGDVNYTIDVFANGYSTVDDPVSAFFT